jgi:predicted  nucleic acid-binding Zn-ribbon protein
MQEIDNLNDKLINLKMQYADILTKYHSLEKDKDDLNNEIFNMNIKDAENIKNFNDEINKFQHEL